MGYGKLKTESYSNIGGINQKASTYVTGDKEVLDLENLDFQVPGAWNKRWGFTAAYASSASFSVGASQTINAIWQVTKPLDVYGGTASPAQTLELVGFDSGVFKFNTSGSTLVPWVASITTSPTDLVWDHSEVENKTYYSNGNAGFTSAYKNVAGDSRAYFFGMPAAFPGIISGGTAIGPGSAYAASTTFTYRTAFLDVHGFVGPLGGNFNVFVGTSGAGFVDLSGFNTSLYSDFGVTATVIFRNRVPGFPSGDFISVGANPVGSATFTDTNPPPVSNQYLPYGGQNTIPSLTAYTFGPQINLDIPLTWNISEIYQNRLWIDAGLNQITYSELEDYQNILPENVLTIAANNFRLVGMKAYNQSLMILCQKGIFRLTGDNPDNFYAVNMSTEYGLISDKSIVVYNEKMWFLDYESIVEFNGSNFTNVGNRVDGYLNRMNKSKAYRRACGMHLPERNEVWFSIPIDGSEVNNLTLVYDYLVDGWTTFRGDKLKATALAPLYKNSADTTYAPTIKEYYFGSIGASIYKFGESFTSDDGTGITLSFTTRYHNELGKSQTAQFRRFYLDIGSYVGPTLNFGLAFYANYSNSTISYTTSMNFNQWQDRIDFGIPAKSLSVRVAHGSTTGRMQINGYTMEFRFQRAV